MCALLISPSCASASFFHHNPQLPLPCVPSLSHPHANHDPQLPLPGAPTAEHNFGGNQGSGAAAGGRQRLIVARSSAGVSKRSSSMHMAAVLCLCTPAAHLNHCMRAVYLADIQSSLVSKKVTQLHHLPVLSDCPLLPRTLPGCLVSLNTS